MNEFILANLVFQVVASTVLMLVAGISAVRRAKTPRDTEFDPHSKAA